jgi:hypothetical protein
VLEEPAKDVRGGFVVPGVELARTFSKDALQLLVGKRLAQRRAG